MATRDSTGIAERLHSACIRLLRRVRAADVESGLSGPKLSALSVLVFGGPQNLSSLARTEQVLAPTMSKLVAGSPCLGVHRIHGEWDVSGAA